jgi:hypothetical protein
MNDSSKHFGYEGLYSNWIEYRSLGRILPVPLSVGTEISLGRRTKENCWGRREWFSMTRVTREALLLKTFPKSI